MSSPALHSVRPVLWLIAAAYALGLTLGVRAQTEPLVMLPTGGWTIDTGQRDLVRIYTETVGRASPRRNPEATGTYSPYVVGSFRTDRVVPPVIRRLNFFRAFVGAVAYTYNPDPQLLRERQEASQFQTYNVVALRADPSISPHYPPSTLPYWTPNVAAGSRSELSFSGDGAPQIDSFIADNLNPYPGHRQTLLDPWPRTAFFGQASPSPFRDPITGAGFGCMAISTGPAVFVSGLALGNGRTFIAWPAPGFVPRQMTPTIWSFDPNSYLNGNRNVGAATAVTVTRNGAPVVITGLTLSNGLVAWSMPRANPTQTSFNNLPFPSQPEDGVYEVSLTLQTDAEKAAAAATYSASIKYTVTVFEGFGAAQTAPARVTAVGSATPAAATPLPLTATAASGATSHSLVDFEGPFPDWTDACETLDNLWSDYLDGNRVLSSYRTQSGKNSWRLFDAGGGGAPPELALKPRFIPRSSAASFSFSYSVQSFDSDFAVEASADGGATWTSLKTIVVPQTVIPGLPQNNIPWTKVTVPLGAYLGQEVQLRFRAVFAAPEVPTPNSTANPRSVAFGRFPYGTGASVADEPPYNDGVLRPIFVCGTFLDDLSVSDTDVYRPRPPQALSLPPGGGAASFTPAADAGGHWHRLVVRPEYFNGFPYRPGPGLPVYISGAPGVPAPQRLLGVSTRARVDGTAAPMIAGVVITGSTTKKILLRAVGPQLAAYGLTNFVPATRLELFDAAGKLLAANQGWDADSTKRAALLDAFTRTGTPPFTTGSSDSALLLDLAPGNYTAVLTGAGGAAGVALVEAYEFDAGSAPRLFGLSTRAVVDRGDNVMIGGITIAGPGPQAILVRAVGPGLAAFGLGNLLTQPRLEIYRGAQLIATNDGWDAAGASQLTLVKDAATRTGDFPLAAGAADAALVTTLDPGSYTFKVSNRASGAGTALFEVYQLP